jgi:hypothetical protein
MAKAPYPGPFCFWASAFKLTRYWSLEDVVAMAEEWETVRQAA